jgi:hypothetical protein
VNRALDWIEALPGPTWLAYLGIILVSMLMASVGLVVVGDYDPGWIAFQMFWALFIPLTAWLMHHLGDVAVDALDTFSPALTSTPEETARLRYELAVAPARPALVLTAIVAVATLAYYVADPVGSQVVGLPPLAMVLRFLSELLFGSLIAIFVYQSIRQLRAVGRIHDGATRVDLFQPAPLYAFSVLTSQTAMAIGLMFIVPSLVTLPTTVAAWWIWLPWLAAGVVLAGVVFVYPLRGMQRRITLEKRRLQAEVGGRIETTIAASHRAIDSGDLAAAASIRDTLGVLVMERDLVDRLPTLPWRPGTLGALVSAIVLPLGLFLVTRLLERVI